MEARGFRPRFFGMTFGVEGSLSTSAVGDKSWDSVTRVRRRVVVALGVALSLAGPAAFRGRPRPLPVLSGAGAGVKSSSSSCMISGVGVLFSSSSESSTTGAFLRVAAARVDFRGDTEAISTATIRLMRRLGRFCADACLCSFLGSVVGNARTSKQEDPR